ncbi:hypothetical protein [Pedobacter nototheniae]|uniref:hypothetical protein n=1 Tax=Pedobacter nototheniae TaxID=2488994 RepID=UPI00103924BA|nr:hypothetical protein [Pedobacter nototheniae]
MSFVKVGEAFYNGNSKSSTWKGNAWNWMKEHFDVAGGYSLSFGAQIGGGFKEGLAARINIYSTVHSDVEFSYKKGIKGTQGGMYNPGEKNNWGIGAAYYLGFDYKGQIYKGVKEHELSLGVVGFGGKVKLDNSGNVTDWFVGFDPSVNAQFFFGIEANFRIGFSK